MASLGWAALAARLGITVEELEALRTDTHAPKGRSVNAWLDYLGKFEQPKTSDLPGTNEYDVAVNGAIITYAEARLREQVTEQIIKNEKLTLEVDKERGKLITAGEFDAGLLKQQQAFLSGLDTLVTLVAADFPAPQRNAVKKKARAWINAIKKAVHKQIIKEDKK